MRTQSICLAVGVSILSLAACGGSDGKSVGGVCTASDVCADGLTCDTTLAGGICTKACTMTGETGECPEGAICDAVGSTATVTCVQICETTADCQSGFDCNGVSGSNIKACKPNDEPPTDAGVPDASTDATP